MEVNLKFFFVACVFSLLAEILHNLNIWLLRLYELPIAIYSWITIGLAPVQLAVGVILPFAVLYILSTRIGSEAMQSVIVSTFLGCWVGGISIFAVNYSLLYSSGIEYGGDTILQLVFWIIWEVFASSLSSIFFVSLAAILFAHYRKTAKKQTVHA